MLGTLTLYCSILSIILLILYIISFLYLRKHEHIRLFYNKNAEAYEIDFNMKSLLNTYNIAWILVFIIPLLNLATLVIIGICLLCMGIINTIKNIPEFISKTLSKFSNIEERK